MSRHLDYFSRVYYLALALLLVAAALPDLVVQAQSEPPRIRQILPTEGRCDSEVEVTITGINFTPETVVSILADPAAQSTQFDSSERLRVRLAIPADEPPGPRTVVVRVPGQPDAIREGGFTIVCPEAPPPQRGEPPRIDRVEPGEGRRGSTIQLRVLGANFPQGSQVFVRGLPGEFETRQTRFISPGELVAEIVIAENAAPGPRAVEVVLPERGAISLDGVFVIQGDVAPSPDLAVRDLSWKLVEQNSQVLVTARIENISANRSPSTVLRAQSQAARWSAQAPVRELGPGESEAISIKLNIPETLRGTTQTLDISIDPGLSTEPSQSLTISIPRNGGSGPDLTWLITLAIVGTITIGGVTLSVRYNSKIKLRQKWQEQAKAGQPDPACQPCTYHCEKIKLEELELARRSIAYIGLTSFDPVSGAKCQQLQVKGEVAEGLNRALNSYRRNRETAQLQPLLAPVTAALLAQIGDWLRHEPAPRDVFIDGHLIGSKAKCKFVLRHCLRKGTEGTWEQEDEWTATVTDECDEAITTLSQISPAAKGGLDQRALELTRCLTQFITAI